jgi:hypothetical protein
MMPSAAAREKELIVGGELQKSESAYIDKLGKSIKACMSMLKRDRWLSIVFQHWNTAYFDTILSSAAEGGGDLRAAVPQVGDTIWSMHKKKGNESVLAGELILTFCNIGKPIELEKRAKDFDIHAAASRILSSVTSRHMYGEQLFNQVILAAWNSGAIGSLHITKDEFNELIRQNGWHYDDVNHYWVKGHLEEALFSTSVREEN